MLNALRSLTLHLITAALLLTAPFMPAHAALVTTEEAMALEATAASANTITEALAREEVRRVLRDLGVEPDLALERVKALTPAELAAIEGQLQDLPAGGSLLSVLGIVLVVLIVLDLVGVTDVFSRL
ncbi:MAG: PA2779 family protein [Pseudomonadales bacterium]|jgi:hypothetical protein